MVVKLLFFNLLILIFYDEKDLLRYGSRVTAIEKTSNVARRLPNVRSFRQ